MGEEVRRRNGGGLSGIGERQRSDGGCSGKDVWW